MKINAKVSLHVRVKSACLWVRFQSRHLKQRECKAFCSIRNIFWVENIKIWIACLVYQSRALMAYSGSLYTIFTCGY